MCGCDRVNKLVIEMMIEDYGKDYKMNTTENIHNDH